MVGTMNINNISRMTGGMNQTSNFIDDSKLIEMLQNDTGDGFFQEIDMGQIDDEDKQYLIFDKDTGKVYDIRNEHHLQKITDKATTRLTTDISASSPTNTTSGGMTNVSQPSLQTQNSRAWSDWWKDKRKNDQDFLAAAENGSLDEVKRLLDKE